jgi:PH (Pleckstrin Homology) domain-containing protein
MALFDMPQKGSAIPKVTKEQATCRQRVVCPKAQKIGFSGFAMLLLQDRGTNKMIESDEAKEPVLWQTYVSWNQFAWLYVVSLIAALRGALLWQAAMPGSGLWMIGAVVLMTIALALRYWVRYVATPQRVLIKNAFTGREIQAMSIEHISDTAIKQGLIARLLGIGTIVFTSIRSDEVMEFRGVRDPESTLQHIQTVRRRRVFPTS